MLSYGWWSNNPSSSKEKSPLPSRSGLVFLSLIWWHACFILGGFQASGHADKMREESCFVICKRHLEAKWVLVLFHQKPKSHIWKRPVEVPVTWVSMSTFYCQRLAVRVLPFIVAKGAPYRRTSHLCLMKALQTVWPYVLVDSWREQTITEMDEQLLRAHLNKKPEPQNPERKKSKLVFVFT